MFPTPDAADRPGVRTTCPYCGVGCGLIAQADPGGDIRFEGDSAHPANFGRICSKGAALGDTLDLDGRLLHPEIGGRRTSWDEALDAVALGFARTARESGPDSIACYVSGQLLTEDYYVINKLMKGFLGSSNIDTNSRLCMSSAVAGHKRAFGSDTVPGCYEDFEQAELILLVGSNTAWCHPVLYQRIAAAKERNPALKIVVIDPRTTATRGIADLHLALTPGTDALLFNGLLVHLARCGSVARSFVTNHTAGLDAALLSAWVSAPSTAAVSEGCGLPLKAVETLYRWFAATERTVTAFSQGINQSSSGTDKVNAILNCHLLTGRIGRPGMGPFSLTGQPNAMGGREVGGLANQLAAHMDFASPADRDRVRRFWNAPRLAEKPGLLAVDLFRAVAEGRIRALWIQATNPVVSLPDADRVRDALERCPLVIVSDAVRETDTTRYGHVLLPALAWGEKEGTVTNSERRISRQRAFLPPPGEARPDWWIATQVAHRLGFAAAFPYASAADVFREHAALSAFENGGARDFDLGGLAGLTDAEYAALAPVQWPLRAGQPRGTARLFGNGAFWTPDRKARFIPVTPRLPTAQPGGSHPLVLNTGRLRDQWHTMTRTAKSARLSATAPEPCVDMHPDDVRDARLGDGNLAHITGKSGSMIARVRITADQPRGSVFVPIHWNDRTSARARVGALIPAVTDPCSGQPEFKHAVVRVEPFRAEWHGIVFSRSPWLPGAADYWTRVRGADHWRTEIAGSGAARDWPAWARSVADAAGSDEWIELVDARPGMYRGACLRGGRLDACILISPHPRFPDRARIGELFRRGAIPAKDRAFLLAERPRAAEGDDRTVCSCFGVGAHALMAAIRSGNLATAREVGKALRAGTNCGSCIPEINALLVRLRLDRSSA